MEFQSEWVRLNQSICEPSLRVNLGDYAHLYSIDVAAVRWITSQADRFNGTRPHRLIISDDEGLVKFQLDKDEPKDLRSLASNLICGRYSQADYNDFGLAYQTKNGNSFLIVNQGHAGNLGLNEIPSFAEGLNIHCQDLLTGIKPKHWPTFWYRLSHVTASPTEYFIREAQMQNRHTPRIVRADLLASST